MFHNPIPFGVGALLLCPATPELITPTPVTTLASVPSLSLTVPDIAFNCFALIHGVATPRVVMVFAANATHATPFGHHLVILPSGIVHPRRIFRGALLLRTVHCVSAAVVFKATFPTLAHAMLAAVIAPDCAARRLRRATSHVFLTALAATMRSCFVATCPSKTVDSFARVPCDATGSISVLPI